jgi:xylulokinase
VVPERTEAACLGAAVLAGCAAGIFRDARSGAAVVAGKGKKFEPSPAAAARYDVLYRRHCELAEKLAILK